MSLKLPAAKLASQVDIIHDKLDKNKDSILWRISKKIAGAALANIPWYGSFMQASIELLDGQGQLKTNDLYLQWLEEHTIKLEDLKRTMAELLAKVGHLDEQVAKRLESPAFLSIVGKAFRSWDQAESQGKRTMLCLLLSHAAASKLCEDYIIKLFIEWIDKYHETHFKVLRAIYDNNESTRESIWDEIDGRDVRDDSAEADLFKMLIRDITLGGVIHQDRDVERSRDAAVSRSVERVCAVSLEYQDSFFLENRRWNSYMIVWRRTWCCGGFGLPRNGTI